MEPENNIKRLMYNLQPDEDSNALGNGLIPLRFQIAPKNSAMVAPDNMQVPVVDYSHLQNDSHSKCLVIKQIGEACCSFGVFHLNPTSYVL